VFTIEESMDYIEKLLDIQISESDIIQIETLAETLGRLPLALGMPSLQLYAGVSSFETKSPVSSRGLKLGIKTSSF
jgi:hypothetical protein